MSAERSRGISPDERHLLEALDHPPETQGLVEEYAKARIKWEQLERSFYVCVKFILDEQEVKRA